MTKEPLVSIVLPTYNGSRYLSESIQSCIDQTCRNWELVIVDDASTDETPSIIARFVGADPRITSVRHPVNRKLPAALNTGFSKAKGEYLTWTSDDNLYRPEALETMAGFLDSHPDVAMVYADNTEIDEDGRPLRLTTVGDPEELVYRNVVHCCFLYRREVHERLGGYSEAFFLAEDWDFWIRAGMRFRFAPLHRDLCLCRRHPGSLGTRYLRRVPAVTERILRRSLPKMTWVGDELRAYGYLVLAARVRRWRDAKAAYRYLFSAVSCSPRFVITRMPPGVLVRILVGEACFRPLAACLKSLRNLL